PQQRTARRNELTCFPTKAVQANLLQVTSDGRWLVDLAATEQSTLTPYAKVRFISRERLSPADRGFFPLTCSRAHQLVFLLFLHRLQWTVRSVRFLFHRSCHFCDGRAAR
ncbi:MAG: hypothetical protein ACK56I_05015, partial [bacterium]